MRLLLIFLSLITLTACAPASTSTPQVIPISPSATLPNSLTTAEPSAPPELPVIVLAVADLSQRLGIDPTEVLVASVEETEFALQGLGCDSAGASESPVVIPALVRGLAISLHVGEAEYLYHAHGRMIVYCGP